jgi:hypothetical protein
MIIATRLWILKFVKKMGDGDPYIACNTVTAPQGASEMKEWATKLVNHRP